MRVVGAYFVLASLVLVPIAAAAGHMPAPPVAFESGARTTSVADRTVATTGSSLASGALSSPGTFAQRVHDVAHALAADGVAPTDIRLPYVGTPARVVDGAVVPGYAVASASGVGGASEAPVPAGVAYFGENDTNGTIQTTVVNASSVVGSLTVNQLTATYLDTDTADLWGIQQNTVLGNVTLHGVPGYEFWTQNAVDVYQHNQTIQLGDDTWNFSGPGAFISSNDSSILAHGPHAIFSGGVYVGIGPWLSAPEPFTLTLYSNSSVTPSGHQELWYNYSLTAAGGHRTSGSYDYLIFNSGPSRAPIAPFVADGTQLDPVGAPNDFELDFGIGGFNGATMTVLSADVSARLGYCPVASATCSPTEVVSVPAAEDFGGETGETSAGLAFTYQGTTAYATAGPTILRGLWGFAAAPDGASGSIAVQNRISTAGAPVPTGPGPYVFVFFSTASLFDASWEWAPDVPVWHLAPGVYQYTVLLADYAQRTGTIVVGPGPAKLAVTLTYHPASGVYTPLWALSNAELAGISSAGKGTVAKQYVLFNNPTAGCTACGGAADGNLSPLFFAPNDYGYPEFPGILLDGTSSYTDVVSPPSFCVYSVTWETLLPTPTSVCFDLQLEFVSTSHVTLRNADLSGGWPDLFEVESAAFYVDPTQNFFPQADVMLWNSSNDLVMSNTFVPTLTLPSFFVTFDGPSMYCTSGNCVAPDGLLLYGGSHNTVWGNTFRDPTASAYGDVYASWAGLAEGESGDLIYNNNFSIDNPVVWLPFDVYTDACPDGLAGQCGPLAPTAYADTWNVSAQAADHVSAVVNGFPLSGNILGPAYPMQGGNFWSDYGNAYNAIGSLPFVNVFPYVDYSGAGVLPPGTNVTHASIEVGGDYLPLVP